MTPKPSVDQEAHPDKITLIKPVETHLGTEVRSKLFHGKHTRISVIREFIQLQTSRFYLLLTI